MYKVSKRYNEVIYSQDAKHKFKLIFNGKEYETASVKTESVKVKSRILSSGDNRFSLDNFVSKEVEIIINDVDLADIIDPVSISIGTLVDNEYEFVPIGIFNLQETPTTNSNKTTIKLRDNSVKFDNTYDASKIIEENNGTISMLSLLKDICNTFNVELATLSFPNQDSIISVWDNTITARQYIMYIAEKAGCIATINREGKLELIDLKKEGDKEVESENTIEILDALERPLKSLKIYGKSQQETRSGKNICKNNNTSIVLNGVTITKNKDGSITLNGTPTDKITYRFQNNNQPMILEEGKNYIYSTGIAIPTGMYCRIQPYNSSSDFINITNGISSVDISSTRFSTRNLVSFIFITDINLTFDNFTIYPMCRVEGTSDDYEPYGVMPSPEFPSEIESIPSIENLLNPIPNTSLTWKGGILLNTANYVGYVSSDYINTSSNEKYSSNYKFSIFYYDKDKNYLGCQHENNKIEKSTGSVFLNVIVPSNDEIKYARFNWKPKSNDTDDMTTLPIMLNKGDEVKSYVPYGHYLRLENKGKNLFDINWLKDTNIVIKNGEAIGTASNFSNLFYINNKFVPNTNYGNKQLSISVSAYVEDTGKIDDTNGLVLFIRYTDGGLQSINFKNNETIKTTKTLTTIATKDIKNIGISFYSNSNNIWHVSDIMIVEGDTPQKYEPYREDVTFVKLDNDLCSINDTRDELDVISGKGIKQIGEYVFTGDESINGGIISNKNSNLAYFYMDFLDNVIKEKSNAFCTHFKKNKITLNQDVDINDEAFSTSTSINNNIRFMINKNRLKDSSTTSLLKESFKTYLKEQYDNGTPVKIQYVLETPEEFEVEPTEIKTYEGTNNISLIDDLETKLSAVYEQQRIPIELPRKLIESYKAGEKLKITRMVYEDAIRKFEFGDETGATVYINSANPYITSEVEIKKSFNNIKNFEIYSLLISKIIGNPAIDPWDIVKFTDKNIDYYTLGQNDLTYNGICLQTFDTQIGTKEKSQENVTINSNPSNYKRIFTRIDQVEGNVEINTSQITNIQDNINNNYYTIEQSNQLIQNAQTGVTNTFSEAGGNNIFRNTGLWFENDSENSEDRQNNPYEFWEGKVIKNKNDKSANMTSLLLQKGNLVQEQSIPNGNYTASFKYKKLIPAASCKVIINDVEYILDSTVDKEFVTGEKSVTGEYITQPLEVNIGHINIKFVSDTNNACEIYDLMVNAGTVKLAYSQNQNETTTDTVNISKGITITSSNTNVQFKANSDGIRILDKNADINSEPITKFTDTGMTTKKQIVEDEAQIVGILIQKVSNQVWFTKI